MPEWCGDEEYNTRTNKDSFHQEPCRRTCNDEPEGTEEYESPFGTPRIAPFLETETVSMNPRFALIKGELKTALVQGAAARRSEDALRTS